MKEKEEKKSKKTLVIIILVVLLLLLAYQCSRRSMMRFNASQGALPNQYVPPGKNTNVEKTPYPTANNNQQYYSGKIYFYDKVKYYEYTSRVKPLKGTPTITTYVQRVSSVDFNGVPAYQIEAEIPINSTNSMGFRGYTRVIFDKAAEKCIQATNILDANGKITEKPGPCGPSITYGNPVSPYFMDYGTEQTTVPLGTFNTKMVGYKGSLMYYLNDDIPVPVRMIWGDPNTGISLELVRWNN